MDANTKNFLLKMYNNKKKKIKIIIYNIKYFY